MFSSSVLKQVLFKYFSLSFEACFGSLSYCSTKSSQVKTRLKCTVHGIQTLQEVRDIPHPLLCIFVERDGKKED